MLGEDLKLLFEEEEDAVGGEMLGPLEEENIDWIGLWTSLLISDENIDCVGGGWGGDMVTSDCLLGAELVNIGLRSGDALR